MFLQFYSRPNYVVVVVVEMLNAKRRGHPELTFFLLLLTVDVIAVLCPRWSEGRVWSCA